MLHYLIDGNNVIGKISSLKKLQKKDKQGSREKLALLLERYFSKKNVKLSLHFDGYQKEEIRMMKAKIIYSKNLTADEMIKREIEMSKNPKNLVVVTSDTKLQDFAVKCSCTILSSEDFFRQVNSPSQVEEEDRRIKEMDNPDEFKRLFGV